jgi:hypothetical protein
LAAVSETVYDCVSILNVDWDARGSGIFTKWNYFGYRLTNIDASHSGRLSNIGIPLVFQQALFYGWLKGSTLLTAESFRIQALIGLQAHAKGLGIAIVIIALSIRFYQQAAPVISAVIN